MYIVMSSKEVVSNWDNIKKDYHNNNPEIDDPYEYIQKAREGKVFAGGYQIIICDKLPKFERSSS